MRTPYLTRQPFTNNTSYQVGQYRTLKGITYIVTAITYNTKDSVKVYGMPVNSPMKLNEFLDHQKRREAGQINIYVPGTHILTVINDR